MKIGQRWHCFQSDPYLEALEAELVAGDGISIRVQIWDGQEALERQLEMTLLNYDEGSFRARDINGKYYQCRWDQVCAWQKRV